MIKSILITGAHGFLGKHLVEEIARQMPKSNNQYNFYMPRSHEMNCLDYQDFHDFVEKNYVDAVIHLAAQCGGIGANKEKPGDFFLNNAIMGINLLKIAKTLKLKKVLTLGTVCSYPKFTPVPFKEEDLWNGYPEETNAPYGFAKKNLLVGGEALSRQYGLNFVHLIPVNMYGEYDNFDLETSHVIPAMIRKFHEAKIKNEPSVTLWGDGSPSREFLYAGDCAKAILSAFENYDKPDPINIGAGLETNMKDLATKIKDIIEYKGELIWDTSKPNGQPRRSLDTTKAEKEFGFKAATSLDEGLKQTCEWYLKGIGRRFEFIYNQENEK
jgi:GDP-L-fucose synthase